MSESLGRDSMGTLGDKKVTTGSVWEVGLGKLWMTRG